MSSSVQNTMLAFIAVAALAMLVQTIGILVLLLMARKATKNLRDEIEHYRSAVMPLIMRTRELVQTVAPKIETAADELSVIATKLREETTQVSSAASDIINRTQTQVNRVDHIVSSVFDHVERAGVFMTDAVAKPMRQVSGLVASLRAVVESLRGSAANRRTPPPPAAYRYTETVTEMPTEEIVPPAGSTPPVSPL